MKASDEQSVMCPHGMPLADNVCGPCSKGRPNRRQVCPHKSDAPPDAPFDPRCAWCQSAKAKADRDRVVAAAIRNVCELPDYTSPPGRPDLLQCTVSELETCIRRAIGEDV